MEGWHAAGWSPSRRWIGLAVVPTDLGRPPSGVGSRWHRISATLCTSPHAPTEFLHGRRTPASNHRQGQPQGFAAVALWVLETNLAARRSTNDRAGRPTGSARLTIEVTWCFWRSRYATTSSCRSKRRSVHRHSALRRPTSVRADSAHPVGSPLAGTNGSVRYRMSGLSRAASGDDSSRTARYPATNVACVSGGTGPQCLNRVPSARRPWRGRRRGGRCPLPRSRGSR